MATNPYNSFRLEGDLEDSGNVGFTVLFEALGHHRSGIYGRGLSGYKIQIRTMSSSYFIHKGIKDILEMWVLQWYTCMNLLVIAMCVHRICRAQSFMYRYAYLSRSSAAVVVDSAEVELLAVSGHARLHRAGGHVAARRELPREHRWHQHLETIDGISRLWFQ